MDDNSSASTPLELLSMLGGAPRVLTSCGTKDGQPRWSPRGDRIAFVARRDQQGAKDDEPQLYLIAPDGGEAQRAATVATGVDAFRWCPDGRRLVFVSWVWPELKGQQGPGPPAQGGQRTQGDGLRHQRIAVPPLGPQPAHGPRAASSPAGAGPRQRAGHPGELICSKARTSN